MTIPTGDLLARLSTTIRAEIAPEVGGEYPRTQAFMASVILDKLAKEVTLGPAHRDTERADMAALVERLAPIVADAPSDVVAAVDAAASADAIAALGPVIAAVYRWGPGEPAAADALAAIRPVLRRDIDRRMEIAR